MKIKTFLFITAIAPLVAFCGGKDIDGNDLTRASKLGYVDGELTTVGNVADFASPPSGYYNVSNTAYTALQPSDIVNVTVSTATNKALSANMGHELQEQINNLKARGRYLSIWDCAIGLARTNPTVSPYLYKAGDYFIVGNVSTNVNYRPDGTNYVIGVASTNIEESVIVVNDTYYYDGSAWSLLHTDIKEVSFANIAGDPDDNIALSNRFASTITSQTATNIASGVFLFTDGLTSSIEPFISYRLHSEEYGITCYIKRITPFITQKTYSDVNCTTNVVVIGYEEGYYNPDTKEFVVRDPIHLTYTGDITNAIRVGVSPSFTESFATTNWVDTNFANITNVYDKTNTYSKGEIDSSTNLVYSYIDDATNLIYHTQMFSTTNGVGVTRSMRYVWETSIGVRYTSFVPTGSEKAYVYLTPDTEIPDSDYIHNIGSVYRLFLSGPEVDVDAGEPTEYSHSQPIIYADETIARTNWVIGLGYASVAMTTNVVTNIVTKSYVEDTGANWSWTSITNAPNAYSWSYPNCWYINVTMSNRVDVSVIPSETVVGYMVFSNDVEATTSGTDARCRAVLCDDSSIETPSIKEWKSFTAGGSITSNGVFSADADGLYRVSAEDAVGKIRYVDIPIQSDVTTYATNTYYATDVAGTIRASVNGAALTLLQNATVVSTNWYEGTEYKVYSSFTPRMSAVGTGAGNVKCWAVSQHILSSAKHYAVKQLGANTFSDGVNSATVYRQEWVSLSDWAATNGFTAAEIAEAGIDDICLIRCSKSSAVPDGCIPYFMKSDKIDTWFGGTLAGVQAWMSVQDHTEAIPTTYKWEGDYTLKDVKAQYCRMGTLYPVHSGDSGRCIFMMKDGNPIMLRQFGTAYEGPSFVNGFKIIKAFVENYGDTLKEAN